MMMETVSLHRLMTLVKLTNSCFYSCVYWTGSSRSSTCRGRGDDWVLLDSYQPWHGRWTSTGDICGCGNYCSICRYMYARHHSGTTNTKGVFNSNQAAHFIYMLTHCVETVHGIYSSEPQSCGTLQISLRLSVLSSSSFLHQPLPGLMQPLLLCSEHLWNKIVFIQWVRTETRWEINILWVY